MDPFIVAGFIASLNVTVTGESTPTSVAPFVGTVDRTVGGVTSGAVAVVNVEVNGAASGFPARSFAAMPTVSV